MVHCGNSMRAASEEVAGEFERKTGIHVDFNFGGSETLLPAILVSKKGDVFVCHDPFGAQLSEKGLLEEQVAVGRLVPVMIVAKGNPLGIKTLADLTRPGVRVGLMDARYSTCGEMLQNVLREKDLFEAVQKNIRVETRSHNDLAVGIRTGHLDTSVVWNFIAVADAETVDMVTTGEEYPPVNVTVCMLKYAENPEAARAFLKTAASEFGLEVFKRRGYTATPR
jgi:molybdate transport system substrate-binding protein